MQICFWSINRALLLFLDAVFKLDYERKFLLKNIALYQGIIIILTNWQLLLLISIALAAPKKSSTWHKQTIHPRIRTSSTPFGNVFKVDLIQVNTASWEYADLSRGHR